MIPADLLKRLGEVPKAKKAGNIILLNGTSSSGKTTLAKLLQQLCYDNKLGVYLFLPIDNFTEQAPPQVLNNLEVLAEELPRLIYAFQATIPIVANWGINMIVDCVFTEKEWAENFFRNVEGIDVISIGVKCSLEKTIERETARGNRPSGLAEYQFNRVHWDIRYDLTVDTTETEPEKNAQKIFEYIQKRNIFTGSE